MSRPQRLAWVEAVKRSTLKPNERLVAREFADQAGDDLVTWAPQDRVAANTGLSESTVRRCVRALEESGWLLLLEAPRQHFSARYRLMVPPRQTGQADTSGGPQTGQPDTSETGQPDTSESAQTGQPDRQTGQPDRQTGQPDTRLPPHHAHTTTTGAVVASPSAVLASVVVDGLPPALQTQISRGTVEQQCRRLVNLAWTPELLGPAVRNRPWNGAGCGAVIEWLRGLGEPAKVSGSSRPPWCGICVEETRMDETNPDAPRRCRRCGGVAA